VEGCTSSATLRGEGKESERGHSSDVGGLRGEGSATHGVGVLYRRSLNKKKVRSLIVNEEEEKEDGGMLITDTDYKGGGDAVS